MAMPREYAKQAVPVLAQVDRRQRAAAARACLMMMRRDARQERLGVVHISRGCTAASSAREAEGKRPASAQA